MTKVAQLVLSEDAKSDLRELLINPDTKAIGVEGFGQCKALEANPYQGDKLRYKANRKPLAEADCRKLKFDDPDRPASEGTRYRVLYRLEPNEGAPDEVYVMAVAPKQKAYGEGTARAAARLRELAGARAQVRRARRTR